jgi:hypothetical protein
LRTPIATRVTLPDFRQSFAWLGSKVPGLTWKRFFLGSPSLSPREASSPFLQSDDLFHSTPRQFMSTAGNPRLKTATFTFHVDCLSMTACPRKAKLYTSYMSLGGRHLDWRVVFAAQVFQAPRTVFSAVEQLSFLPVTTLSIVEGVHGTKHFSDVGHHHECIRFLQRRTPPMFQLVLLKPRACGALVKRTLPLGQGWEGTVVTGVGVQE